MGTIYTTGGIPIVQGPDTSGTVDLASDDVDHGETDIVAMTYQPRDGQRKRKRTPRKH